MRKSKGFILVQELIIFSICGLLWASVLVSLTQCLRLEQQALAWQQCLQAAQQALLGEQEQLPVQRNMQELEDVRLLELEVQHENTRLNLLVAEAK